MERKWVIASRVDLTTGAYVDALCITQHADGLYYDKAGSHIPTAEIVFKVWPPRTYVPIWDFELKKWVEGLSDEEIDRIRNQPKTLSLEDRIKILEAKIREIETGSSADRIGGGCQ